MRWCLSGVASSFQRGVLKMNDVKRGTGKTSDEFYLTLLEEFPALIWRSNVAGECDWFNKTWLEFTGRTMEQEYGSGWAEGVHPDDLGRCVDIWMENLAARTPFVMEYRLTRSDGEYRWIRDFGRPFNDPEGEFVGFIGACYDISDMKDLAAELEHQASHDVLTGLPNRRAFNAEVEKAIAFAGRDRQSTVLFTDVDRFKTCNDLHGHEFGDAVLREVGRAIRAVVRDVDFVARIGGDEFGVLLWGQDVSQVDEVAQRIRAAVESTGRASGVDIGLSIGAAAVVSHGAIDAILSEADGNMYSEKGRA